MGQVKGFSFYSAASVSLPAATATATNTANWGFLPNIQNVYITKVAYAAYLNDTVTGFMVDKSNYYSRLIINIDPSAVLTGSAFASGTPQFLVLEGETAYFKSLNFNASQGFQPLLAFDVFAKSGLVNATQLLIRHYCEGYYEIQG
jgi:hypothetical protein